MGVYLIVVTLHPTAKAKHDDGAGAQIIVQPVAVIADSETMAAAKAWRFIPEEHQQKEDRLSIQVLPFRTTNRPNGNGGA